MTVADTMALTTGTESQPGQIAFYGGFIAMVAATLMLLLSVSRTLTSDESSNWYNYRERSRSHLYVPSE